MTILLRFNVAGASSPFMKFYYMGKFYVLILTIHRKIIGEPVIFLCIVKIST